MVARCKLQIRREPDVGPNGSPWAIKLDDRPVFELDAGELKAIFHDEGEVTVTVEGPDGPLLVTKVALPGDNILLLSLHEVQAAWWKRMLGASPSLALSEVSRTYLATYDPGPVRMLLQQAWLGYAESGDLFFSFMDERDDYYSDENFERKGTPEHIALSAFADAMSERSYDHDFLEYGFAKPGDDLETKFAGHSWVEQWAPILRDTLPADEVTTANVYIMFGVDGGRGDGGYRQITHPKDIDLPGLRIRYIGEVEHPSH